MVVVLQQTWYPTQSSSGLPLLAQEGIAGVPVSRHIRLVPAVSDQSTTHLEAVAAQDPDAYNVQQLVEGFEASMGHILRHSQRACVP